jgi:hypothetical protein
MLEAKASLWSDLWQWFKAIFRHWKSIAGGSGAGVFLLIASIWAGGYWLRVLGLVTLCGSFFCAIFLAWRDEHRKTIGKNRGSILQKAVEIANSRNVDHMVAVIELSDEFGSEEDVEWVCEQLKEHGHGDPFGILKMFKPGFDGKRLKFLQDARVAQYRISSPSDAVQYVRDEWASRMDSLKIPASFLKSQKGPRIAKEADNSS